VGSSRTIEADVRIIGATNADLPALCREGLFKADLLDRLSFEVLFLPPLRSRREDILLLARHFAGRMARETGREEAPVFSPRAEASLLEHPWPGNIRELKNAVERAVYLCDGGEIGDLNLDPFRNPYGPPPETEEGREISAGRPPLPAGETFRQESEDPEDLLPADLSGFLPARENLEREYLSRALKEARHNRKLAARLLGISYEQFRGFLRRYGDRLEG